MKKLWLIFLFSFGTAFAQTTAVTATITDSDGTVWTNASYLVVFAPNPGIPNISSYKINGVPITQAYPSLIQQKGVTNSSGALAVTLIDNTQITPTGSAWTFVIQSNTSAPATSYAPVAVQGASFSLTSYLSANVIAPRFPAVNQAFGYADVEVSPVPNPGGFYFSTSANIQRIWNGSAWQNGTGSGATTCATTTNVLKGNNAAGGCVAATPGTDYVVPSGSVASLNAVSALPNGTTATTQTTGDATTKIATDAFVATAIAGGNKFLQGIGYASNYGNADPSTNINNCIADAIALTNGNTTHICDASSYVVATMTLKISVGNSSGGQVILRGPAFGLWTSSITNGTDPMIDYFGGAVIEGSNHSSAAGGWAIQTSTSGNPLAFIRINTSSTPYAKINGISIINIHNNGHTTASGNDIIFNGPLADVSYFDQMNIYDDYNSVKAAVTGGCCGWEWAHSSINSNYVGTSLALNTTSTSVSQFNQAIRLFDMSIVHPGPGLPSIVCSDTSGASYFNSSVIIDGLYVEGNNSDTTTAPVQDNGCGSFSIMNATFKSQVTNSTAPFLTISNVKDSHVFAANLNLLPGAGNFTYPVNAIVNSNSNETVPTNSTGYVAAYFSQSGISYLGTAYAASMRVGGSYTDPSFPSIIAESPSAGGNYVAAATANSGTLCRTDWIDKVVTSGTLVPWFELGTDSNENCTKDKFMYDDLANRSVWNYNSTNNQWIFGTPVQANLLSASTAVTQTSTDNSTKIATTAFVKASTGAIATGGTGATTATAALSNLLGNPAAGTYSVSCTSTSSCTYTTATGGGGGGVFTHTLTGTTPTIVVNSSSAPATDVNNLILSGNVSVFSLPGSTSIADGEIIRTIISQPTSGGPYTLPTGTANSPFTAGSGTSIINSVSGGCPTIGTTVGGTPSQLYVNMAYFAAKTEYIILGCQLGNPAGTQTVEYTIATNMIGNNTTGFPLIGTVPVHSGHFTNLQIINLGFNPPCTTAPYLNVYDGPSNFGTPVQASNVGQTLGSATNQAQTLTFNAGDNIGIYVYTQGNSGCLMTFAVSAQVSYP